jgi:probable RNA-binding protein EIF1AD
MAGLGRRTHYRKHLTDAVLHDTPEPEEDERIAKVVGSRGSNQFDILLALTANTATHPPENEIERTPQWAILPTKFRKLVWVKRNDFLIVKTGIDDIEEDSDVKKKKAEEETGSIRYIISHILYKDQIKHLCAKGLWPTHDPEFATDNVIKDDDDDESDSSDGDDDGIVYDNAYGADEDDDADLFVNTNRIAKMAIQDSSDSEDDSNAE